VVYEEGASDVDQSIDRLLGDHTKYQTAIFTLQKAVGRHDRKGVAQLVSYPIKVRINGKESTIRNEEEFVRNYDVWWPLCIVSGTGRAGARPT
jgi:hypothetical protein